jgi:tripartite-type tricarboxylate transporter receptor subunit TctC
VSIVGPLVINELLFPSMPYDTAKQIAPITILAAQPSVLVATNSLAAQDVAGLLALIKQEPDKLTYGSIGRGSLSHLAMSSLVMTAGGKLGASAISGLAGGGYGAAARRRAGGGAAGRIRRRPRQDGQAKDACRDFGQAIAAAAELPTLSEAGIANVEADAWVGLIAPAGISDAVRDRIYREAATVVADPAIVAKLQVQYMSPIASTPDEFRAVIRQEHDRLGASHRGGWHQGRIGRIVSAPRRGGAGGRRLPARRVRAPSRTTCARPPGPAPARSRASC